MSVCLKQLLQEHVLGTRGSYIVNSGPAKWISEWSGHGTLKSIVGHYGWSTKKFLNSRLSRMATTATF